MSCLRRVVSQLSTTQIKTKKIVTVDVVSNHHRIDLSSNLIGCHFLSVFLSWSRSRSTTVCADAVFTEQIVLCRVVQAKEASNGARDGARGRAGERARRTD